ncbi:hypothetical protein ANAPC5_01281 [Anaplasma phagocytophilum]|nr:hypothetical protein ANAPC5_01281 [Anaplasma phagocytophilum]
MYLITTRGCLLPCGLRGNRPHDIARNNFPRTMAFNRLHETKGLADSGFCCLVLRTAPGIPQDIAVHSYRNACNAAKLLVGFWGFSFFTSL